MTHSLYQAIFRVASVLEVPVVILALVSLAVVVFEIGAFLVELFARRRRRFPLLSKAASRARVDIEKGDRISAAGALAVVAWSRAMAGVLDTFVDRAGLPGAETAMNKALADFDFRSQRRLGRTRLLVRTGPALGLMGTLIPLSPALEGLARGNVSALTENLRVAFSITVLGLLVGALAFGLSLSRDRIYGQDLSDLEYVAAVLTDEASVDPPSEGPVPLRAAAHRDPSPRP